MSRKICKSCGVERDESEFALRKDVKTPVRRKTCRVCQRTAMKGYKQKHAGLAACDINDEGFWSRVDKQGPVVYPHLGPCWVWNGPRSDKGYGTWHFSNNSYVLVSTHRFIWTAVNGEIPEELLVLHRCDNPPCVNPEHLFLGSYSDNTQDCIRKGRFVIGDRPRGEACNKAKLTEVDVRKIRELSSDGFQQRDIAEQLQVSQSAISCVLRGRTWRHVS